MSKIKVITVDDSSLVRKIIKGFFAKDAEIQVVDEAEDGKQALDKIKTNKYDLILLDYDMPKLDGYGVLKVLQGGEFDDAPPVLVFSALAAKGSQETIKCLLAGAADYIQKPSMSMVDNVENIKKNLREKIISIVQSKKLAFENVVEQKARVPLAPIKFRLTPKNSLVVVGCSTGGPQALESVLKPIPKNFPFPILVVQHMPENFTGVFAKSLNERINLEVVEVKDQCEVKPSTVYIAGGGKHMSYKDGVLSMKAGEKVNFCIPAVDVLFESLAQNFQGRILSIVLTGMGHDGFKGVDAMKKQLGNNLYSIIQDKETSVVWSMPRAVYQAGLSDMVLPVNEISSEILKAAK